MDPCRPQSLPVDGPGRAAFDAAAELLKALGHPLRLEILVTLRDEPRCVHELVNRLSVPQPLVSQHLRILRTVGLVTARRRGREIAYAILDHHVTHIVADALAHAGESRVLPLDLDPRIDPIHDQGASR